MEFAHVTLLVKNLEESLQFYQQVIGLPVKRRFSSRPGIEIVFLGKGQTEIELICDQTQANIDYGQAISLGFAVQSLEETANLMKEVGMEMSQIFSPSPQVKFFYVSDPNGLRIQLIEWVKGRD
ncbi:MAG: VOC family protein [Saccharofermentanales bacterium]